MSELPFSTPQELFNELEDLVWDLDITWMEAVIEYAERKGVEVEAVAVLIAKNPNLKEKIRIDAEALHFLPQTSRLPGLD